MDEILSWLKQLEFFSLLDMVLLAAASVLSITIHEASHGVVALWLGDDTARRQGRLSLNPLHHIDPIGLLLMVVVRFGWAKPVPIDARRFRNPRFGMALTALAGPMSNILIALLALLCRVVLLAVVSFNSMGTIFHGFRTFLEYVIVISSGLAVFNLFPIPPLDGSKVLFAVLPDRWYIQLLRYERHGVLVLAILLLTNILDVPLLYLRGVLVDGLQTLTDSVFYYIANHLV